MSSWISMDGTSALPVVLTTLERAQPPEHRAQPADSPGHVLPFAMRQRRKHAGVDARHGDRFEHPGGCRNHRAIGDLEMAADHRRATDLAVAADRRAAGNAYAAGDGGVGA